MYTVEQAQPLLQVSGDGFLGLGLQDHTHDDKTPFNFNSVVQMKKHGMID